MFYRHQFKRVVALTEADLVPITSAAAPITGSTLPTKSFRPALIGKAF